MPIDDARSEKEMSPSTGILWASANLEIACRWTIVLCCYVSQRSIGRSNDGQICT
jgi:hypothetical protein